MPLTNERSGGSFSKLKQMGQRFLRGESANATAKPRPIPADVGAERRSGRRVALPLTFASRSAPPWCASSDEGREPSRSLDHSGRWRGSGGPRQRRFRRLCGGHSPVCPRRCRAPDLALQEYGRAQRGGTRDRSRALFGATLRKNYRRVVRHYLHHRPLLEDLSKGYFEGHCTSCNWVGRVGKRSPQCSRCRGKVVALSGHVYSSRT